MVDCLMFTHYQHCIFFQLHKPELLNACVKIANFLICFIVSIEFYELNPSNKTHYLQGYTRCDLFKRNIASAKKLLESSFIFWFLSN